MIKLAAFEYLKICNPNRDAMHERERERILDHSLFILIDLDRLFLHPCFFSTIVDTCHKVDTNI